jgi:uncharacterized protein
MSRNATENLLLIAAREPIPGETKTRLGATIGMARAADLYRAFLADLAARFTPAVACNRGYTLGWAYSPPHGDFKTALAAIHPPALHSDVLFVPQDGPDWGTRQTNLLRWGRNHGFERTVLTASDSPQMTLDVIDDAFAALETYDVALGRVHDGGYYLIGTRGFHDVLGGVPMSTTSAADALIARAESMNLAIADLTPTFDVDIRVDLIPLHELLESNSEAAPATARALIDLNLTAEYLLARV